MVDGIEVGEATRSGRKVAKNVAAWEACRRLGLVVSFSSVAMIQTVADNGRRRQRLLKQRKLREEKAVNYQWRGRV